VFTQGRNNKSKKIQQSINREEEGAGRGRITCGMSSEVGEEVHVHVRLGDGGIEGQFELQQGLTCDQAGQEATRQPWR
jgi:hypothetical protein